MPRSYINHSIHKKISYLGNSFMWEPTLFSFVKITYTDFLRRFFTHIFLIFTQKLKKKRVFLPKMTNIGISKILYQSRCIDALYVCHMHTYIYIQTHACSTLLYVIYVHYILLRCTRHYLRNIVSYRSRLSKNLDFSSRMRISSALLLRYTAPEISLSFSLIAPCRKCLRSRERI